jgi:hypothetical protein
MLVRTRSDIYLLSHSYSEGPSPETAVVKTYPVPLAGFASLESPGHVFAANPAKEGWQDAHYWSVVENQRIDGGRVVQRHVLYLGEISPSQAAAWRKSIEVFDADAGHRRTLALFPEDHATAATPDSSIVRLRLSDMRLCRPQQWGACCPAGLLWGELQLDRFWTDRLPANRKSLPLRRRGGARGGTRSCRSWCLVPVDRAGQRVEAAPRLVRPQCHGRPSGIGFSPRRSAQTLSLSRFSAEA